jgi:DNA-binding response OmpR family regulator
MRILYVDENRTIGQLLQNRLVPARATAPDGSCFELNVRTDYAEAAELLAAVDTYDAVVIEVSTAAARNGGFALQLVRSLDKTPVLVIALTALPSLEECIEYMRAGAWDYIGKSRSIDQIAQRLVADFERAAEENPPVDRDAQYVRENFVRLANSHPNQWIAVGEGRFLATAPSYPELEQDVARIPVADPKFWRMPPEVI